MFGWNVGHHNALGEGALVLLAGTASPPLLCNNARTSRPAALSNTAGCTSQSRGCRTKQANCMRLRGVLRRSLGCQAKPHRCPVCRLREGARNILAVTTKTAPWAQPSALGRTFCLSWLERLGPKKECAWAYSHRGFVDRWPLISIGPLENERYLSLESGRVG